MQILKAGYEYQEEAVKAARQELHLRDIDPDLILPDDDPDAEARQAKSQLRFVWYHKAGMLLLPFVVMLVFNRLSALVPSEKAIQFFGLPFLILCYYLIGRQLKASGYDPMAADFKVWTSYSVYIFIGILLFAILVLLIVCALF